MKRNLITNYSTLSMILVASVVAVIAVTLPADGNSAKNDANCTGVALVQSCTVVVKTTDRHGTETTTTYTVSSPANQPCNQTPTVTTGSGNGTYTITDPTSQCSTASYATPPNCNPTFTSSLGCGPGAASSTAPAE